MPLRFAPTPRRRPAGAASTIASVVIAAIVAITTGVSVIDAANPDVASAATPANPEDAVRDARQGANRAAELYFAAEVELSRLESERADLERELDDLVAAVDDAELTATEVAVESFIGDAGPVLPILTDPQSPIDREVERLLAGVAANRNTGDIDGYHEAIEAVERGRADLDAATAAVRAQQERLDKLRDESLDQVSVLRDSMTDRFDEEAAAQSDQARSADDRLADAAAAASEAAARDDELGSIAGGRTGRTGEGNQPVPAPVVVVPPNGMLCPVAGPSGYANTWGQPRSGGRSHQGVDMLAPTGTPLQAVVSGRTVRKTNRLGGVTVSLYGDNGTRYYYAHLDTYEGEAGPVTAGQVIGYVGDSGNAAGTPHLHFEIHPGGGGPINPYSSVVDAGC